MSTLAAFAAALRDPTAPPPAGLGATAARIDVHRNTRVVGLVEALATAYPVARALIGDEAFRAVARACVLQAPPRTPITSDYVQTLPTFIATFPPAAAWPWLHAIATLEALRVASHHAADATALTPAAFAHACADPEALAAARVQLHPAARWFAADHAAHALWAAHQGLDDPAQADLSGLEVDTPQEVLVIRPEAVVHVVAAAPGTCALLDALARGTRLGEAIAVACTEVPGTTPEALFSPLLVHALVVSLDP